MDAWCQFEIKSFDDAERTFEGIASTPTTDRMDDIVEPKGAVFKLPITMLWQHGHDRNRDPIGWVLDAKVTADAIKVKGRIANLDGPPTLKEDLDRAWALIKSKLVRGLSIGFRPLVAEPIKNSFGQRFTSWEWLELSPVSVPANMDASITNIKQLSVKAFDVSERAAFGNERSTVVRLTIPLHPPGASGKPEIPFMTINDQISALENKRAASEARMDEITDKIAADARTWDEAEKEEHGTLKKTVSDIDDYLPVLRDKAQRLIATAKPVTAENTSTVEKAAATRSGIITVKSMAPKGIGVARVAIAMANGVLTHQSPQMVAKRLWPDSPEVELTIKTAVEAGDTTTSGWASQLVPAAQQMQDEFLGLLRPQTIIGRIPGLKRVPFNISIPIETASGTAQWVGEGAAKPVTKLTLSSVTLRWAKAAAIVAITKELAKFSRPDAETVVRDSMVATLVRFFDSHFVSATAEVTNVSPAGILNGISATAVTGTSAAAFRLDLTTLLKKFTTNNVPLSNIVLLMSSGQAVALSLMVTDLGVGLFPTITREGGTILGFPVVISEAVGTKIIALNAPEILLAEDPGVDVSVSDQASVEMDTEPIQGETSPVTNMVALKSFWQNNLIGIRVEQFITWKAARTSAVEYLTGNAYSS